MNQNSWHQMDAHMNVRMSSQDKKIIETAAKLKGFKLNTYARQKLLEIAKKDIEEINQLNVFFLNDQEWNQFLKIMEAPVKVNQNLKKAIQEFNQLDHC